MLNLRFSHAGEWVKIPIEQGDTRGPDYPLFHIGRLERYVDIAGTVRKALAYGKNAKRMKTWYSFDEVKKALGAWVTPEVPFWYNNRKWNNRLRNEHTTKKKTNSENNQRKRRGDPRQGYNVPYRTNNSRRGEPDLDYNPNDYYQGENQTYEHDPRFFNEFDEGPNPPSPRGQKEVQDSKPPWKREN